MLNLLGICSNLMRYSANQSCHLINYLLLSSLKFKVIKFLKYFEYVFRVNSWLLTKSRNLSIQSLAVKTSLIFMNMITFFCCNKTFMKHIDFPSKTIHYLRDIRDIFSHVFPISTAISFFLIDSFFV